ncbi:MAG: hypothetical protein AAFZ07_20390 [Actinomycetota bacterium]
MAWSDLWDQYGKGKGAQVVNRAIRNEVIGGNEALDALDLVARLRRKLAKRTHLDLGLDEARVAEEQLRSIRDTMAEEVLRRYGIGGAD